MNIIAAIDIKNGKCVRLLQGKFDRETVYADDPIEISRRWEREGADMLHIVDLDGARDGIVRHFRIIEQIRQAVGIPVEVGGGIRDEKTAKQLLHIGVNRIVLGTAAFENPPLLRRLIKYCATSLVVALDGKNGMITTRGWQTKTDQSVLLMARRLAAQGIPRLMYTDIMKDGTLTEPNYVAITQLRRAVHIPIIASGGVASHEAINRLQKIGVEGIIIGKALYEGKISLKEIAKNYAH